LNKTFLVLGVILLAVGIAAYYVSAQTSLLGGRTHNIIPLGGIGLAVLGALVAAGGVMMGKAGAKTANQFKCAKCGAVFGSQTALDQHTKDKHGK
jgi:hypothetical protein